MYIVTFYSFKGGTGRSMALANVAANLLQRGRRVLLVDFDLEAPGLDTFPMSLDRPVTRGLVEMITDYLSLKDDSTPPLMDYVYKAALQGVDSGTLWLMPAGCQNSTYDTRFRNLDWQDFYENEGGYFFFEDLKSQWEEALNPDYVLIDSRTGHTDIGGICTRQLPDCVVAMFFPNEQNLRGLVPVVQDIRKEETGALQKKIELHFVMGNVPDLDDEESILSHACAHSMQMLKYTELAATIHHFSSLSMLEQRLLLVDRPRSKIASEYTELASAIVRRNIEDRDGALAVINQAISALRSDSDGINDVSLEKRLQTIRIFHPHDAEILRSLARFRRVQRRMEEAIDLYDQLLQSNERDAEGLLGRAEALSSENRTEAVVKDLEVFFQLPHGSPFGFAMATRLLMMNDPSRLSLVLDSPALTALPASIVIDILQDLLRSYETCDYAVKLVGLWIGANADHESREMLSHEFSLCLIAAGHFEEAQVELAAMADNCKLNVANLFNFAMAEWGIKGAVPTELFVAFTARIADATDSVDPNYLQCLSLAYWAAGDLSAATKYLEQAAREFSVGPRTIFSSWTYLYRSPKAFRADLEAMKTLYETGNGSPAVIRGASDLFPRATVLQ